MSPIHSNLQLVCLINSYVVEWDPGLDLNYSLTVLMYRFMFFSCKKVAFILRNVEMMKVTVSKDNTRQKVVH